MHMRVVSVRVCKCASWKGRRGPWRGPGTGRGWAGHRAVPGGALPLTDSCCFPPLACGALLSFTGFVRCAVHLFTCHTGGGGQGCSVEVNAVWAQSRCVCVGRAFCLLRSRCPRSGHCLSSRSTRLNQHPV